MHPIVLSLAILLLGCESATQKEQRPNILLINVDDLGWRDPAFMGSDFYLTPTLDSLSREGLVFLNAYASAANCAPSRASMFTGQWTTSHGMYTVNSSARGKSQDRRIVPIENTLVLDNSFKVMSQYLKEKGYTTMHAGKWHISESPVPFGFDVNIGGASNGHPSSYYAPFKNVKLEAPEGQHLSSRIMDDILTFVDTVSSPFFINYAPYAVHTPIQPVDAFLHHFTHDTSKLGHTNPRYASMISALDFQIGRLMHRLQNPRFKNTLILFTSDNGGLYGITRQPPLRAGKGSYYEGGIRVPLLAVWPGKIAPAESYTRVTNLDIMPTVLAIIGRDTEGSDGNSLLPVFNDPAHDFRRSLYWHFPIYLQAYNQNDNENRDSLFRTRPGSVIIDGDWKLHYYFENDEMELYNLESDPGERNNVAEEQIEVRDEMLGKLRDWWDHTNAPIPTTLNPAYVEN